LPDKLFPIAGGGGFVYPSKPPSREVIIPSTVSWLRRSLDGQFEIEEKVTMPDLGLVSNRTTVLDDPVLKEDIQELAASDTMQLSSRTNKIPKRTEPLPLVGKVAEMQTIEDPIAIGRVQEPNLEILIEVTRAPRRRVLNKALLSVIPSSIAKLCNPQLDTAARKAKDDLCASVMKQIASVSHPPAERRRERRLSRRVGEATGCSRDRSMQGQSFTSGQCPPTQRTGC
jgi:hypothetical protein